MSRRYGRNQRRQHREEIARLTQDRLDLMTAGADLKDELVKMRDRTIEWSRNIQRVLGPYSPLLRDVAKMAAGAHFHAMDRFQLREPARLSLDEAAKITDVRSYEMASTMISMVVHRLLMERSPVAPGKM